MFPRGDAVSLAKVLTKAVEQYGELEDVRKSGRKVYEENYTKTIFKKKILELLKK
jgi:glycosyltransferase involved in cell wall biosynthesis